MVLVRSHNVKGIRVKMSLPQEKILELLKPKPSYSPTVKPNSVDGPCKYFDKEMRCASKGCSSPTHYKVEGIPYCMTHTIVALNDLAMGNVAVGS